MRVLIAPDKFKGCMSALVAARAMAAGWQQAWPGCEVELAPIADGGEGFAEILANALGAEWVEVPAQDALGRPIVARYAWAPAERSAVLEMSEAAGLWRLPPEERAPLAAHTFGVGQMLRHALERGAQRVLIGLGGSATTDGGTGMAAALGYRFLDAAGLPLALAPAELARLASVQRGDAPACPEIIGACDVTNPLLGPRGTAHIFAPQKGADPEAVAMLEQALTRLADAIQRDLGCDFRSSEGAGAAGGFGFGLMSFCGARLESGFDLVARVLRLEERVQQADLVLTGEGRLDEQTLDGKGPGGVAALAQKHGKPVIGLAGSLGEAAEAPGLFSALLPVVDSPMTLSAAMAAGPALLERAAYRAARLIQLGERLLP